MSLTHLVVLAATVLAQVPEAFAGEASKPIVLKGHPFVAHLVFHPKKSEIAVSSQGLEVYDLQTGDARHFGAAGHEHLAYSPDGRWLAATQVSRGMLSTHGAVQLFDAQSGTKSFAFGGVAAWFSPDGRRLVTMGGYSHAQRFKSPAFAIHDVQTGKSIAAEIHFGADADLFVRPFATDSYVRFGRDGTMLVHGFQDPKQLTWRTVACDLATGKRAVPPTELAAPNDPYASPNGRLRFAGVGRGQATLIDVTTGKQHAFLEVQAESRAVRQLAFHPGGREVIGLLESRKAARLVAWDAATGKQTRWIQELAGVHRNLALSPDGGLAALSDEIGVVRLIDVATGAERRRLRDAGHHERVSALAFCPDGRRFVSGGQRGEIIVWDFAGRRELFKLQAPTYLSALVVHPSGKTAIGGVHDGIAFWDLGTRRIVKTLGKGFYQGLVLSPDGKLLAAAHRDEQLTVWDLTNDQALYHLKGELGRSDGVAFSPDGKVLATAGTDGAVRLWEAATGKSLQVFSDEEKDKFLRRRYGHVAFAGLDRLVAIDDRGGGEVRDAAAGRVLLRFQVGRDRAHLAMHPSRTRVALAHGNGPIQEYDLATGKSTRALTPSSYLSSLTYDSSGAWLVSGHDNGDICLWSLEAP